jgi:hypothetical protein
MMARANGPRVYLAMSHMAGSAARMKKHKAVQRKVTWAVRQELK